METQEYLEVLRKRWLVIAVLGVLGGLAGLGLGFVTPAMYQSTSSVYVASQHGNTTSELLQGATFTQNLVESFAQLVTMPEVLDPVIDELGLDMSSTELARSITVDNRLNTVIIDVTVADSSPERAASIAGAVTDSLARAVKELSPKDSSAMKTVAPPTVPAYPFSPNTRFLAATGLILGLMLGGAYAVGRELLNTRVRGEKDLERISDAPLVGSIPQLRGPGGLRRMRKTARLQGNRPRTDRDPRAIVMLSDPSGFAAESYRRLQTNLEFSDVDHTIKSVVITSTFPNEGKSTVAINLALAMAEHSERVLLIDADLRKPSVANYCQIEGAVGLTSILVGEATFDDAIQKWAGGTVDVLPAGAVPPSPNRLLGSEAMAALMDELQRSYDFIVVDSPPLAPVSDALALGRMTDGVIVVTRYASTRRQQLARTLGELGAVSARIYGVVLNCVTERLPSGYYGYEFDPDEVAESDTGLLDPVPMEPRRVGRRKAAAKATKSATKTGAKTAAKTTTNVGTGVAQGLIPIAVPQNLAPTSEAAAEAPAARSAAQEAALNSIIELSRRAQRAGDADASAQPVPPQPLEQDQAAEQGWAAERGNAAEHAVPALHDTDDAALAPSRSADAAVASSRASDAAVPTSRRDAKKQRRKQPSRRQRAARKARLSRGVRSVWDTQPARLSEVPSRNTRPRFPEFSIPPAIWYTGGTAARGLPNAHPPQQFQAIPAYLQAPPQQLPMPAQPAMPAFMSDHLPPPMLKPAYPTQGGAGQPEPHAQDEPFHVDPYQPVRQYRRPSRFAPPIHEAPGYEAPRREKPEPTGAWSEH